MIIGYHEIGEIFTLPVENVKTHKMDVYTFRVVQDDRDSDMGCELCGAGGFCDIGGPASRCTPSVRPDGKMVHYQLLAVNRGVTDCRWCTFNLFGTCSSVVSDRCGTDAHYMECGDFVALADIDIVRADSVGYAPTADAETGQDMGGKSDASH